MKIVRHPRSLQPLRSPTIIQTMKFSLCDERMAVLRRNLFEGTTLLLLAAAAGCGGPAPAPQTSATPTTDSQPAQPQATEPAPAPAPDSNRSTKTKWVGDIPYDVFFDQPLVVAADSTSLAPSVGTSATPSQQTPAVEPDQTPTTPATSTMDPAQAASTAGGPNWQELVDVDVLNEAVTKLRNRLRTNLNTLATYNRNIDAIANDGACLAALAAVAEAHPNAVGWKDKAKYVRDLGYEIYQKADGTGRAAFDATREPFEQIVAILNGGPPPDMPAEDNVPFDYVADRTEMMKRIKQSYDFLRAEINTEARFKE